MVEQIMSNLYKCYIIYIYIYIYIHTKNLLQFIVFGNCKTIREMKNAADTVCTNILTVTQVNTTYRFLVFICPWKFSKLL